MRLTVAKTTLKYDQLEHSLVPTDDEDLLLYLISDAPMNIARSQRYHLMPPSQQSPPSTKVGLSNKDVVIASFINLWVTR